MRDLTGQQLGTFEFLGLLSEGGMGKVYVAIKVWWRHSRMTAIASRDFSAKQRRWRGRTKKRQDRDIATATTDGPTTRSKTDEK